MTLVAFTTLTEGEGKKTKVTVLAFTIADFGFSGDLLEDSPMG